MEKKTKTPEEIKKGLARCEVDGCFGENENCPYACDPNLCVGILCGDAYAYIQQLEREREAMLRQLSMHCEACKYWESPMSCKECRTCTNPWKVNPKENWEWRGVEEDEHD